MTRRNVYEIRDVGHCQQIREIITSGSGASGGYCRITAAELSARVVIERRHDAGTDLADKSAVMEDLKAEHGGRCHGCGEPLDDGVEKCPVCWTPQKITGQRNAAKRKTIGGF